MPYRRLFVRYPPLAIQPLLVAQSSCWRSLAGRRCATAGCWWLENEVLGRCHCRVPWCRGSGAAMVGCVAEPHSRRLRAAGCGDARPVLALSMLFPTLPDDDRPRRVFAYGSRPAERNVATGRPAWRHKIFPIVVVPVLAAAWICLGATGPKAVAARCWHRNSVVVLGAITWIGAGTGAALLPRSTTRTVAS
jgi:hypothetical protein